ncbi:two-component sensor histidine kinase [Mycobacterium antarcticum]|nr:two-component sensor histidine kinase [Mycolicibacterium sp. TUM20984]
MQLSIAGALIVFAVVACAGLGIAWQIGKSDRAQFDASLLDRSSRAEGEVRGSRPDRREPQPPADRDHGRFGADDPIVRVIADGQVIAQTGPTLEQELPLPGGDGFSTVRADGEPWRSFVRPAGGRGDLHVQVLQSLRPLEEHATRTNLLVLIVTAVATVFGAAAGWVSAGILLRPLQKVREAAVAIRDDRDAAHRLPDVARPREVADLTDTLNGMLDRLQTSTATARRFTADAGHELRTPLTSLGAYIETLNRPSEPAPLVRRRIVSEMAVEYQRLVDLLNGLQSLARGDARALPAFTDVDVRQLVQDATTAARRRHPDTSMTTRFDETYPLVNGWAEGIRLAVDNLLDNAALHGRPGGEVGVAVGATDRTVTIAVDDDGPGIPPEQRAAMVTRFARGADTTAKGSGLGLALVLQQAEIHGGAIELADSTAGGLSARLSLPAADESTAR